MALRIRANGRILCAALHPEMPGDTYLHDGISYRLTVELGAVVTEPMFSTLGRGGHAEHGEWWWANAVPEDVVLEAALTPDEPEGEAMTPTPETASEMTKEFEAQWLAVGWLTDNKDDARGWFENGWLAAGARLAEAEKERETDAELLFQAGCVFALNEDDIPAKKMFEQAKKLGHPDADEQLAALAPGEPKEHK